MIGGYVPQNLIWPLERIQLAARHTTRHKMAARQAANPRRPGARVSVPTLGLDGAAGPNTFVDFLAPNPMVLSQRVEEPAQASRKRSLPASEPPLEQRQVERVNHLSETRLTEQLVTHRRYRPCTTQMSIALSHFAHHSRRTARARKRFLAWSSHFPASKDS